VTLANASPLGTNADVSDKYRAAVDAARKAIISTPSLSDESKGDGAFATSDGSDVMSAFYSFLAPSLASMKAGTESKSGDPIGDMISFGHNLLALWEAGILAVMGSIVIANAAEAGAFASIFSIVNVATLGGEGVAAYTFAKTLSTTANFIGPQLMTIFSATLIVGIIQAFVLPMLPMIMVFVMGISWLILFLEAAIAGVLWAFAFIRMDGQEMFDKNQAPGITLLFNLFLRPAISMLAFIGGLKLLPEVMNSLSILWDSSFNAQTEGGGLLGLTSLIQWVVGLVMFTWMQWHLTMRIFGLIPTIADRVGHWMGFGQMHAYNDGHETTAAIGAAVAAGQVSRQLKAMPNRMSEAQQRSWGDRASGVRERRMAKASGGTPASE
jgi:conjugal transfer/type IV secretion protein DotA/TraY